MEKNDNAGAVVVPAIDSERFHSLDVLRGFAVLGILFMNINGFAMHIAAYDNPLVAGGSEGWNLLTWLVVLLLVDGKMRALFALMFGASLVLLTSRAESKGADSADYFYRRNLWLLLIGVLHAYLLWMGDILYAYALCALLFYPFRRMKPKALLALGAFVMVCNMGVSVFQAINTGMLLDRYHRIILMEKQGEPLDWEDQEVKAEVRRLEAENFPSEELLAADQEGWRGGFFRVMETRANSVFSNHSDPFYGPLHLDIWATMLLGMALLPMGVLTAARSRRFYWWMLGLGYAVGLPICMGMAVLRLETSFEIQMRFLTASVYDIGRILVAMGHLAIVMLVVKSGLLRGLVNALSAAGRMALSNYLLQSLICSTLFCGYGFRLYGELERHQLFLVALCICIFQLFFSVWWFKHFRFGPFEWAWRALTYWKRPAFRREA